MDFSAHLDNLAEMLAYIRNHGHELGVPEDVIRKMELACEEALVNVISYAYPNNPGKISLTCKKNGDHRFEVEIRDWGIPFNPIDVEVEIEKDKPIEDRKVGGLGIYLIRKTIDEISYRRDGEENIFRLALNF